ncbi:hypothetical protein evm_004368 [Chilo suppressalis]|nr:hypothetical protein evm_004368 [Chilo suppressalis]
MDIVPFAFRKTGELQQKKITGNHLFFDCRVRCGRKKIEENAIALGDSVSWYSSLVKQVLRNKNGKQSVSRSWSEYSKSRK